ncbi:MAG: hypothetical protein ACLQLC_12390 [Candidatus Sulfotelmatobacter sp.]
MKIGVLILLLAVFSEPATPEPAITYFRIVRDVSVTQPGAQNFFVVDEDIWEHARPDLGDLRIYDGETPVQYALSEQRAETSSEESGAKLLNLGRVAGHTEFDLDAQGIATYDRIRLHLDAKDYVITATVDGSNELGKPPFTTLTPSTLYDFTSEQLGSNSVLKLPPSSFRYLHVKISGVILPQQIKGAAIFNLHEQKASWTKVGSCAPPQRKQRTTVIRCDIPPKVPLNRILFEVEPRQVNFRRSVSIETSKGEPEGSGEITRVRMNRAGTLVTNEELGVDLASTSGPVTIAIANEDNPPLAIVGVQALSLERRIYFDPQGKTNLKLYYGDEKISPPVYDYARFFHLEESAAQAQLGAGVRNPQYATRPDVRPWSEQHMGVLWAAMIVAVIGLGSLAIRGMRSAPKT